MPPNILTTYQGFASSSAVRYFGVFLTTGGVQANVPAVMAYQVKWTPVMTCCAPLTFDLRRTTFVGNGNEHSVHLP